MNLFRNCLLPDLRIENRLTYKFQLISANNVAFSTRKFYSTNIFRHRIKNVKLLLFQGQWVNDTRVFS